MVGVDYSFVLFILEDLYILDLGVEHFFQT